MVNSSRPYSENGVQFRSIVYHYMVMIQRLLTLPLQESLFLFGARNTGKSTLIRHYFSQENSIWFDLLKPSVEQRLALYPDEFEQRVLASEMPYVVVDEIQKLPQLLDSVHSLIESTDKHFILTGSSARKLRHGASNLLAGRAFVYNLYPFSYFEIQDQFNLIETLKWGTLPRVFQTSNKKRFLQSYANTYLKEEIFAEQLVRKLDPFRRFLQVAAQMNGKIINFSKIAKDVGCDDKTVQNYFTILQDTLIGFFLEPYHHSFRKRLSLAPKFYFFDTGVTRALADQLSVDVTPGTYTFGNLFEQFIILECVKLNDYYEKDFQFSYLRTKDDAEIDLVVERPGKPVLLIEIKSSTQVTASDLSGFIKLSRDMADCEAVCFSCDPFEKMIAHVHVYPWQMGLEKLFKSSNA